MSIFPCATVEALKNLEIVIDGERLFEEQRRTRGECAMCCVLRFGVQLSGVVLLLLAGWMALRGDYVALFYMGILGTTLLVGGLVGLRQYQNAPQRITLNDDSLIFHDTWTNDKRVFPRTDCLEVRTCKDEGCGAIFVVQPDGQLARLVDGLPPDVVPTIVTTLNEHLGSAAPSGPTVLQATL